MVDIDCWDCGKRFNIKNHLEAEYGDFKVFMPVDLTLIRFFI